MTAMYNLRDNKYAALHKNTAINHHGAEISVIWLVEQSPIKLLLLIHYLGKIKL